MGYASRFFFCKGWDILRHSCLLPLPIRWNRQVNSARVRERACAFFTSSPYSKVNDGSAILLLRVVANRKGRGIRPSQPSQNLKHGGCVSWPKKNLAFERF